ncbi:ribosome silencing factor [Anaerotalea alkaliphila]|uniref:Ribosomal silencing factor RsfS n=1 Tax=Anaerotalea alkaliphila TaxID=2662126 RepID=A0A7X5HWG3_9FIRM|nr:ribosome silencing factor [Anaerotalea alkaliphila]NDL67925.1 ribosome silencing factor [Anaerotalea alkaliphila]
MSQNLSTLEKLKIASDAIKDKKGEDVRILDIRGLSVLADYFIIAHGNNVNHVQAMVDAVDEKLSKAGVEPKNVEGAKSGGWTLMDYTDFIVHVFGKQERMFYDLEKLWTDGKEVIDL